MTGQGYPVLDSHDVRPNEVLHWLVIRTSGVLSQGQTHAHFLETFYSCQDTVCQDLPFDNVLWVGRESTTIEQILPVVPLLFTVGGSTGGVIR